MIKTEHFVDEINLLILYPFENYVQIIDELFLMTIQNILLHVLQTNQQVYNDLNHVDYIFYQLNEQ